MVTSHILMLINGGVASICSVLLNSLLSYLVLKHTPTQMKAYSRLMLMHAITDVIYDIVTFSIGPLVITMFGTSGSMAFMIIQGLFIGMDGPTTKLLFSIANWVSLTAVMLIPIDFVYRYLSVCHNYELSTRVIYLMVLISYFVTWIYIFPINWLCLNTLFGPSEELSNYTKTLKAFPDFSVNVPTYALTVQDPSKPYDVATAYIMRINLFTIFVIFFTSIRISWTIRHKASVVRNERAMKVHKQVTRILTLQAGLPILVVIGPIIAILISTIVGLNSPLLGLYIALTTIWFSSLKPFMTILLIEKYRKHVFSWLIGTKKSTQTETTSYVTSTKVKPATMVNARSI